jgi:UPF0755 protein
VNEWSERTPEEREQARLEREARRAARAKGEKPSSGGLRLPKVGRGASAARQKPDPPAAAPPETPAPPPAEPPPAVRRRAPRVDLERINRLVRRRREERAALAPDTATEGSGRRRRLGRAAGVAALVAGIAILWLLVSIFQPFKGDGEGRIRVAIPTGSSVGEIADQLERQGVISSATFFEVRTTITGRRGDLKPGVYELKRDMSYGAAIDALAAGPPRNILQLVIPEGRSRREIAAIVRDAGLDGSYTKATIRSRRLNPRRYGARRTRDLEGFLFPATYELKRGTSVRGLVARQLDTFKREFGEVSLRFARRKNLTAYDVLIIASMVEREAQLDRERPLIASVIYNRLKRDEPLGIDATIRFATNNWTEPLTESDLALDSAYNTRRRVGLPPGPIGNPGLASIRAAARPARTSYLFYVVKPGGCGEHEFSRTLAEFERDAARYNRERRRRGGKSPTDC